MFYGEYRYQLDNKNRLRVPAKLRGELGETFHLMKGSNGCLYVFDKSYMDSLTEKIKNVPISDKQANLSLSLLFSATAEVENDEQGRFLLPPNLKKYAQIDKNVVIIGAGSRLEIWAEEVWDHITADNTFDSALEQLGKYGI